MSSAYVSEPATKGKVIISTTCGELDIELWPKEAPKACRNFVQLCLEGYYDDNVFHRIIPGFIAQTGDPSGTGDGGKGIYDEPFPNEIHTRLRFSHRGIVAMAGQDNMNDSQFFVTLDACDFLQKKHTIFGKVVGDTIYNVMKLGEVDVDDNDRPIYPVKIKSVEILVNPFDDIVCRTSHKEVAVVEDKDVKKKKRKKNTSLLSFGEEADAEDQEEVTVPKKIMSSHDVLDDPRLMKEGVLGGSEIQSQKDKDSAAAKQAKMKNDFKSKIADAKNRATKDEGSDNFAENMRLQAEERRAALGKPKVEKESSSQARKRDASFMDEDAPDYGDDDMDEAPAADDDDDMGDDDGCGRDKKDKLSFKASANKRETVVPNADLMTPLEAQRQKYIARSRRVKGRQGDVLSKLASFTSSLRATGDSKEKKGADDDDDDDGAGWMSHQLKFNTDVFDRTQAKIADEELTEWDPRKHGIEPKDKRSKHQQRVNPHHGSRGKKPERW